MEASLTKLLDTINEANTNITNRIGTLGTHIEDILDAGRKILKQIELGLLSPRNIDMIYDKLQQLRTKTLSSINEKNGKITEIQSMFAKLLAAVSPNGMREGGEEEEEEEEESDDEEESDEEEEEEEQDEEEESLTVEVKNALQDISPKSQTQMIPYAKAIIEAYQQNPITIQLIREIFTAFNTKQINVERFIHYINNFPLLLNLRATNLPTEANYARNPMTALTNVLNQTTAYPKPIANSQEHPPLSSPEDHARIQTAVKSMLPTNTNIRNLLASSKLSQYVLDVVYIFKILETRMKKLSTSINKKSRGLPIANQPKASNSLPNRSSIFEPEPKTPTNSQKPASNGLPNRSSIFEPETKTPTNKNINRQNLENVSRTLNTNIKGAKDITKLKLELEIYKDNGLIPDQVLDPIKQNILKLLITKVKSITQNTSVNTLSTKLTHDNRILLGLIDYVSSVIPTKQSLSGLNPTQKEAEKRNQIKLLTYILEDLDNDTKGSTFSTTFPYTNSRYNRIKGIFRNKIGKFTTNIPYKGGHRKTRCGCGISARRTLRGGRRRKTQAGTRKAKAKTRKTRR
jgi:hypothetical protein